MYVCICRRVTVTEVQDTIARGARTVDEVGQRCGAGTDCGACHDEIHEMLAESRAPSRPAQVPQRPAVVGVHLSDLSLVHEAEPA